MTMTAEDIARVQGVSETEIEERRAKAYENKTLVVDQLIAQMCRLLGIFDAGGKSIERNLETLRSEIYQLEATAHRAGANLSLIKPEKSAQFFRRFRRD